MILLSWFWLKERLKMNQLQIIAMEINPFRHYYKVVNLERKLPD